MEWGAKTAICVLYDILDFTFGRLLFLTPFAGEVVGVVIAASLFGWGGVFYALEGLDPTEQFDGFIPAASIIAFANRPQVA